jgi:DNA-directed RNA polymerase specialized sigma subunit
MIERYEQWQKQPTPENMQGLVDALEPTITSEIQRFGGPQELLRSKARSLAIKAVKTYKPESGAHLKSWVVTQLQPLSRYTNQLKPVYTPEVAVQHAAEVNRVREQYVMEEGKDPTDEDLADLTGLSVKRIASLKSKAPALVSESIYDTGEEESTTQAPAVTQTSNLSMVEDMVYESLNDRDKTIHDFKVGRHGKPVLSNQEIAARLGISPAAVSQRSAQIASQIADLNTRNL